MVVAAVRKYNDYLKTAYRQQIALIVLTIVFFTIGQFGYEGLYRLTLYSIRNLSSVSIIFYGKFPFLFGDTKFSSIIASIPFTVFLISKLLRHKKNDLIISIMVYSICFLSCYLFVCFATSLSFHSMNDFYHGETIKKNLSDVDINEIFLTTIILSAVLTSIIFLLVNLIAWIRRKLR